MSTQEDRLHHALEWILQSARKLGAVRCRDLVSEHIDVVADEMGQDTSPDETLLLEQIATAFLTLEGWQDTGANRVVIVADLDRASQAHFQWRSGDGSGASPAYRAAILSAVKTAMKDAGDAA